MNGQSLTRISGSSTASGIYEEVVDYYGFKVGLNRQQVRSREQCELKLSKRRQEWETAWSLKRLPRPDIVKKMIRKGVPPEMRAWVWYEVSGAKQKQSQNSPRYYEEMVSKGESSSATKHQIKLDLPRTFPGHAFIQSEQGQLLLWRVLVAYSVHNPKIGYCQGMNYVAAFLLVAMVENGQRNDEKCFWMMATIIEDLLYPDMYSNSLKGAHVEMRSLMTLVQMKLPKLGRHLNMMQCDMSLIATDWFICLFITSLPSETTARVWDAFFNEGPKVLFRVALAILKIFEPDLIDRTNPGELLHKSKKCAASIHHRDNLMKVCFNEIGSMPMARIQRFRVAKDKDVTSEMNAAFLRRQQLNGNR
eukprot:TRINITY_DN1710_c0_g1_i3.p1 TRINITY_DN1710_c0_g1~~TRINITY_DN1710_c0_g1_i3.p1  ORF type:complete len:362 (-),score=35.86 TRINITY_DN1710_c0_g1_i3:260-1345(-)